MGHDILIVDDERDICTLIAGILEDEGHTARRAHNSTEAIDAVRQRRPALVILDVWLQGSELDGLQLLEVIRREEPPVPVVMISGHGTIDTAVSAIKTGAYDFIEKPFKADRLLLVVDRAIEADRLRRENASLRRRAGGEVTFVGSSGAAANVRSQLDRVAPTGSRVLITGPSGAGKETVARLIHQGSKRADGPFVVVNCSALPAERLELELFGTDGESGRGRVARLGRLRDGAWRHAAAEGGRRPAGAVAEPAGARAAGTVLHPRRRHHQGRGRCARAGLDRRAPCRTRSRPALSARSFFTG